MHKPQECQKTSWKEGGHKSACQRLQERNQRARLLLPTHLALNVLFLVVNEDTNVTKRDNDHFLYIAAVEAKLNERALRTMAQRDFPGKPMADFAIRIDHTVFPANYNLIPADELPPEERLESFAEPAVGFDGVSEVTSQPPTLIKLVVPPVRHPRTIIAATTIF